MNEGGKHMESAMHAAHETTHEIKSEKKESSKALLIAMVCIALIAGIAFGYFVGTNIYPATGTKSASISSLTPKLESYLTENFLKQYNASAKIVNYTDMGDIILFNVSIIQNGTELDKGAVYTTKDGEYMVNLMYNLSAPPPFTQQNATAQTQPSTNQNPATADVETACKEMSKVNKPKLEAFVVSNCPYGLQMQRVLYYTAQLLGNESDIKIRYIGSISNGKIASMHGDQEAVENQRQICIREEQGSKYWDYVNCYIKNGDSSGCLTSTGVNKATLDACMNDSSRGLKYAQVDFDLSDQYGVTGSPTLILNGKTSSEFTFGGRDPEAVKQMICCSFAQNKTACNQTLETAQAAIGFSATYSSTGATTNSGSNCG